MGVYKNFQNKELYYMSHMITYFVTFLSVVLITYTRVKKPMRFGTYLVEKTFMLRVPEIRYFYFDNSPWLIAMTFAVVQYLIYIRRLVFFFSSVFQDWEVTKLQINWYIYHSSDVIVDLEFVMITYGGYMQLHTVW